MIGSLLKRKNTAYGINITLHINEKYDLQSLNDQNNVRGTVRIQSTLSPTLAVYADKEDVTV